jgi:hypothetical protein
MTPQDCGTTAEMSPESSVTRTPGGGVGDPLNDPLEAPLGDLPGVPLGDPLSTRRNTPTAARVMTARPARPASANFKGDRDRPEPG